MPAYIGNPVGSTEVVSVVVIDFALSIRMR